MSTTGATVLLDVFRAHGIDHIFGIPGGHLLKFYDALYDAPDMKVVLTKHEAGAAFMAMGFAQTAGRPAVCVGTVGPGATNLITGVASAFMDSVPMLALTAQVGTAAVGKGGLQEAMGEGRSIDHLAMFSPVTKHSTRVFSTRRLADSATNAIRLATSGRPGPVHLDVLADVFAADVDETAPAPAAASLRGNGDAAAIREAARLLAAAEHPAMLIGAGALGAADDVAALSSGWGIPVATTLRAKGIIPEDEPWALGCVGLYGTNLANKYLRDGIDVLLAIGVSFHEFTTHAWDGRFAPAKALIQIDVDPWEIGKNYHVHVPIVGDAGLSLAQLRRELDGLGEPGQRDAERRRLAKMKMERRYFADPKRFSDAVPIKPQRVMQALREAMPAEALLFGDIGNSLTWVEAYYPSLAPGTFFIGSGLASMGYGVAACVGGKFGRLDRPVVCVCGDGDFQMQGMELMTAVNYELPVTWVILDNCELAMVKDVQDALFSHRGIACEFANPDFVALAQAFGARGWRVERPDDLVPALTEAMTCGRPALVDVVIDPAETPPFDARAEAMVRAWGTKPRLLKKLGMVPELVKRM